MRNSIMSLDRQALIELEENLEEVRKVIDPKGFDEKSKQLKAPTNNGKGESRHHAKIYYANEEIKNLLTAKDETLALDKKIGDVRTKVRLKNLVGYLSSLLDGINGNDGKQATKKFKKLDKEKILGPVKLFLQLANTALGRENLRHDSIDQGEDSDDEAKPVNQVQNLKEQIASLTRLKQQLEQELEVTKKLQIQKNKEHEQVLDKIRTSVSSQPASSGTVVSLSENIDELLKQQEAAAVMVQKLQSTVDGLTLELTKKPFLLRPELGLAGLILGSSSVFVGVCFAIGFLLATNPVTLPIGLALIGVGGFLALYGLGNLAYNVIKTFFSNPKETPKQKLATTVATQSTTAKLGSRITLSPNQHRSRLLLAATAGLLDPATIVSANDDQQAQPTHVIKPIKIK